MILIGIISSTLMGRPKEYLYMDSPFCLYKSWTFRFYR